MRLGITGHQSLPKDAVDSLEDVVRTLNSQAELTLVGSLAEGADQIAASAVVRLGGQLEVIIPSDAYEETFGEHSARIAFAQLLGKASRVTVLPFPDPSEFAYMAAGILVVERCTQLLAVWDGLPSRGLGGTADVVRYARREGRDVRVIWPAGASRA